MSDAVMRILDGPVHVTVDTTARTLRTLLYRSQTGWAADTATSVGDRVVPSAEGIYLTYRCTAAAGDTKTGASEPAWPTTPGETVVDDQVTWVAERKHTVQPGLRQLTLIPAASGQIYWADGTATASSPPWPPLGAEVYVMPEDLLDRTFIAAGDVTVQVVQEGVS